MARSTRLSEKGNTMKRSLAHHRRMLLVCLLPLAIAATILAFQGTGALLPTAIFAVCGGMMVAMLVMVARGSR
ncbi:MAG: hypothetical protein ACSLFR_18350 [Solirubrobacteraceae bacterium]